MTATTGELLITVHAASDLQDTEQWGEQDPFCVLSFSGAGAAPLSPSATASGAGTAGALPVTAATRTAMKGGVNPEWRETLALPITADPGELVVQVFNQNRAAPDSLIGYGSVQIYDVLQQGSAQKAVPLTAYPSNRAQGFVHLGLQFRPLPGAAEAEAAARADMQAEPQLHAHDREPLPELVPGAEPSTDAAAQPPAMSDLRPVSPPRRQSAYDRVHRPGYLVPPGAHT
ncbi:hypothetical protein ABPG75_006213 [Micractinium tetrahymenae]